MQRGQRTRADDSPNHSKGYACFVDTHNANHCPIIFLHGSGASFLYYWLHDPFPTLIVFFHALICRLYTWRSPAPAGSGPLDPSLMRGP